VGNGTIPDARAVGLVQVPGHAAGLLPVAPGQGDRRKPERLAVLGEGVDMGVRGGVVGLAGAAERPGDGGVEDERGQVGVTGEFVQVPGGVDFGPQDRVQLFRGE
jgi:hypothetical protein